MRLIFFFIVSFILLYSTYRYAKRRKIELCTKLLESSSTYVPAECGITDVEENADISVSAISSSTVDSNISASQSKIGFDTVKELITTRVARELGVLPEHVHAIAQAAGIGVTSIPSAVPVPTVAPSNISDDTTVKKKRPGAKKLHEKACRRVLEDIFGVEAPTARPEWLDGLELDCYIPSLKLALEYQGIQHYNFPNVFHKTRDEFLNQLRNDKIKATKCKERGVNLILVDYTLSQKEIPDYIIDRLHELGYIDVSSGNTSITQ